MNIELNILEIIEQGKTEGSLFYLPPGQLDRKTYLEVNKVLECLGGKWDRKSKAHVFESDISGRIDDVLLTGQVIDTKKEFQFFETPIEIVNQLIQLAEIRPEHTCLEPSAGHGNIARGILSIVVNCQITCVEINVESANYLMDKGFYVEQMDFLQYDTRNKFDRIVMNPPFHTCS